MHARAIRNPFSWLEVHGNFRPTIPTGQFCRTALGAATKRRKRVETLFQPLREPRQPAHAGLLLFVGNLVPRLFRFFNQVTAAVIPVRSPAFAEEAGRSCDRGRSLCATTTASTATGREPAFAPVTKRFLPEEPRMPRRNYRRRYRRFVDDDRRLDTSLKLQPCKAVHHIQCTPPAPRGSHLLRQRRHLVRHRREGQRVLQLAGLHVNGLQLEHVIVARI